MGQPYALRLLRAGFAARLPVAGWRCGAAWLQALFQRDKNIEDLLP